MPGRPANKGRNPCPPSTVSGSFAPRSTCLRRSAKRTHQTSVGGHQQDWQAQREVTTLRLFFPVAKSARLPLGRISVFEKLSLRQKAPNSKLQAHQAPSSKTDLLAVGPGTSFGGLVFWALELLWSLGFGAGCFNRRWLKTGDAVSSRSQPPT